MQLAFTVLCVRVAVMAAGSEDCEVGEKEGPSFAKAMDEIEQAKQHAARTEKLTQELAGKLRELAEQEAAGKPRYRNFKAYGSEDERDAAERQKREPASGRGTSESSNTRLDPDSAVYELKGKRHVPPKVPEATGTQVRLNWKTGDLLQLTSQQVFEECQTTPILRGLGLNSGTLPNRHCLIAFLPRIWDGGDREAQLAMLREVAQRQEDLRVTWTEGGQHSALEQACGVTVADYPAAVLIVATKKTVAKMRALPFDSNSIFAFTSGTDSRRASHVHFPEHGLPVLTNAKPYSKGTG